MEPNPSQKLDNVDFQILRILQEDSRTSYRKIGEHLGIAVGTVYNRIKRLESEKVLKAYTAIVEPTKIGYDLTALILIQARGLNLSEVEREIAQSKSIICVYDITGDFDIAVIARFENRSKLDNFIKEIRKRPNISRTVTNVALNVVKEDFRVPF